MPVPAVCAVLAVSAVCAVPAVCAVCAVLAVLAVLAVHAVRPLGAVRAVRSVLPVLAILTVDAIRSSLARGALFAILAVLSVRAPLALLALGAPLTLLALLTLGSRLPALAGLTRIALGPGHSLRALLALVTLLAPGARISGGAVLSGGTVQPVGAGRAGRTLGTRRAFGTVGTDVTARADASVANEEAVLDLAVAQRAVLVVIDPRSDRDAAVRAVFARRLVLDADQRDRDARLHRLASRVGERRFGVGGGLTGAEEQRCDGPHERAAVQGTGRDVDMAFSETGDPLSVSAPSCSAESKDAPGGRDAPYLAEPP